MYAYAIYKPDVVLKEDNCGGTSAAKCSYLTIYKKRSLNYTRVIKNR
jgi:hypothetical protein